MAGSPHFLLVTFPAQGHINPTLQFAKRLVRAGARVSFATSVAAHRRMADHRPAPEGLITFVPYSDGFDDGFTPGVDAHAYMSEIRRRGSETLREIVLRYADEGRPLTCIAYTLLLPWAAEVAREFGVPSALLWIQPATVLDLYYYYFNGFEDAFRNIMSTSSSSPSSSLELPGLPVFSRRDLPSFLVDNNAYTFILPTFQEQLEVLSQETNPKVLVNSFDALEPEAIRALDKLHLIGIGPLVPSAHLDGKDPSDNSFRGDLFKGSGDYIEWLNSKPKSSVIYVSFGSISTLGMKQKEDMARALLDSGRPFLWVIRKPEKGEFGKEEEEKELSCREELEEKGMIVGWCSQVEVLRHPSVGCFVSHCGWNSTLESLVSGVPMVGFPQWTDQGTNAKLMEDVWGIGVRVTVNEDGIVESDEFKRCFELVMGEGGGEMRRNVEKWKGLARDAVMDGGSSDINLKIFMDEVGHGHGHGHGHGSS